MSQAHTQTTDPEPANLRGDKRSGFFRRSWAWGFVAVLVAAIFHFLPLLQSHASQDECSFGPVSNKRYRELLAEAKGKQSADWPHLVWDKGETEKLLQSRFDDLSRGSGSVYERIAAMHAVMRALGAEYRRTGRGSSDPYGAALNGAGIVPFNYHLDLNRLGYLRPIKREMWAIGRLAVKQAEGPFLRQLQPGAMIFTVWFPEFMETHIQIPRSEFGEACPLVPPPSVADRLGHVR